MSNQRFIELSSANRNRNQYPSPASFVAPFSSTFNTNQTEYVKGVYMGNKIVTKPTNTYDVVTNGIIEYLWAGYPSNLQETGHLHYDSGSGDVQLTNQATIMMKSLPPSYVGELIFIMDGDKIVGSSFITSVMQIDEFAILFFSSHHHLMDGYTYTYNIYTDYIETTVVTSSTASSVSVSGLTSVYSNVVDYYVGYMLTANSSSTTIISYDPSSYTFGLKESLGLVAVGSIATISDPSTNEVITLPGIDLIGNEILDYSQSYNNYYIIDETQSSGSNVVYSKISSYNYATRALTLAIPFQNWNSSHQYSLRKSLPQEFISSFTPSFSGNLSYIYPNSTGNTIIIYFTKVPSSTFPFTPTPVTSLNFNYVGLKLSMNDTTVTIQSVTIVPPPTNPGELNIYQVNLLLYGAPFTIVLSGNVPVVTSTDDFTINPTFNAVPIPNTDQYYPQISLSNCIFLSNANNSDNFYAGKYIYIYPQSTSNNQTTSLTNIRGSCYYINAYVGNGYNACFVTIVDTPTVTPPTQFYPSYLNTQGQIVGTINIVSFAKNNYTPLIYNGSMVSQNELVAYEINLISLILPNLTLTTGSRIANYPYVYVELTVNNNISPNVIYSNNPKSGRALFSAAVTDIKNKNQTPFIKLWGKYMVQTVKFKPNDSLKFSVFLPDGTLFQTIASDFYSPSAPNPFCQIDALFGIQRL